jgi:ribosome biogenesis protein Nip4
MKEVKEFRVINNIERKIIETSISEISSEIQKALNNIDFKLYISLNDPKQEYPAIYLVPNDLSEFITTQNIKISLSSAGLYFGFIKKGKFLISLEGSEYLFQLGAFSLNQQIFIDHEGEKSILYGNNISKKMIISLPNGLKKDDFILVLNLSNELIAIAMSQIDHSSIQDTKDNDLIALNLIDKGYYLRKKQ